MQVKGVSVKSVVEYIKKQYPQQYRDWLNALPDNSQVIFKDFVRVNEWYPLTAALTLPIKTVGKLFFNDDWKKAARIMGRFSADDALTGIYKLYVKIGTPRHIIDRAGRIMSAYFQPSEIRIVKSDKSSLVMHIIKFDEPDEAIENNIAGWIERALEISGCKDVEILITKSLARKDTFTEF